MPSPLRIRSAAVLGAGTMGAQIAAHLANAGYPVWLLDMSRDAARAGLERARELKPDPFFTAEARDLIKTGGFDSDLDRIAEADWIIEAIIEQAGRQTSAARAGRRASASWRRSSAPTHRGCPSPAWPRDEAPISAGIGSARIFSTRRDICRCSRSFPRATPIRQCRCGHVNSPNAGLGKNVVVARDTPGFIANHVAMHGLVRIFDALGSRKLHRRGN